MSVRRAVVTPLSAATHKVVLTADAALKAKLEQAEELMRHRVGRGNLVAVIDRALDLLIAEVKKERFGVGRRPRATAANAEQQEVVTLSTSPTNVGGALRPRHIDLRPFAVNDGRRVWVRAAREGEARRLQ